MKKKTRKVLSMVLTLAMTVSLLNMQGISALAEEWESEGEEAYYETDSLSEEELYEESSYEDSYTDSEDEYLEEAGEKSYADEAESGEESYEEGYEAVEPEKDTEAEETESEETESEETEEETEPWDGYFSSEHPEKGGILETSISNLGGSLRLDIPEGAFTEAVTLEAKAELYAPEAAEEDAVLNGVLAVAEKSSEDDTIYNFYTLTLTFYNEDGQSVQPNGTISLKADMSASPVDVGAGNGHAEKIEKEFYYGNEAVGTPERLWEAVISVNESNQLYGLEFSASQFSSPYVVLMTEPKVKDHDVTFDLSEAEGATVTADDDTVLKESGTATAKEGSIVFTVKVDDDHELISVIVDGSIEARKNEATEAEDDYIIEGIETDDTVVTVTTEEKGGLSEQLLYATIFTDGSYTMESSDSTMILLRGMMPRDAFVKAYPVEVEIEGINVLAAYDISIFDADGEEFEPEDDSILVEIDNAEIQEALAEDHEVSVFHMEDTADAPEEIAVMPEEAEIVTFFASQFSIYVVGEDGSLTDSEGEAHYVYTVNFYDEVKGEQTLISTQVVSPGEKLEQPATPDKEHYTFDGWYSGENGTGEKYLDLTTDSLPEGITEDTEIDLYAHYIEIYYVYYMATTYAEKDNVDEVTVFHTEAYNPGDELNTAQAEQLYLAEGYLHSVENDDGTVTTQAVTAWLDADGNEYKTGDEIRGHLELYPVVEEATWIYFDVNGKNSSVDPMYVLESQDNIGTLPEAECEGYTFDGWYTEAEDGTEVTSDTLMSSLVKNDDGSVTLYAHWTADTVSYTINIWLQKATDGQEGLDNKEIHSGETYDDYIGYYDIGETIHVSESQSNLRSDQELTSSSTSSINNWGTYTGYATTDDSDSDSIYYGFEYSGTEAQTRTLNDLNGKVVASDGSTIINIFYNRMTVYWTFYQTNSKPNNWNTATQFGTLIGLYDTNLLPENGSEAAGSIQTGWTLYTSTSWGSTTTYNWVACYGTNYNSSSTIVTFETRFRFFSSNNSANTHFYYTSRSGSRNVHYYKEITNTAEIDENGDKAKEASDNGASYTKTVSRTTGSGNSSVTITKDYVYDRTITTSSTAITLSDKYKGYYVVGYGTSSSSMTAASAGGSTGTISNNTCIYNDAYEYTITFISSDKNIGIDTAGGYIDGGNSATYTYKYGAALDESIIPTNLDPETWGPNSYSYFTGDWYVDTTMTALFSLPDTMPENNLVAYAQWQVKEITVDFVTNGHADVPESQTFYAANCATDPSPLQNVQEGYTHVGWVDQYGKIFNFATMLYDDTTLTAIWQNESAEGHELTYNLNLNGLGDLEEDSLKYTWHELFTEGAEEELLTVEKVYEYLGLTADEDHYEKFVCWNTQPDGSGTNYYPEDEIVFADQAITLYAIWAIENESTLHLDYNYPEGETTDTEYYDKDITGDNLTSIVLDDVSDIHTGDTITVAGVTYRFEGWTANTVTDAETATKDSVEIDADATVAVDNLSTNDANTLHAVWVAIYTITVTKEVVDSSNSYPNVDADTFSFSYSVADGEAQTVEGIVNDGTFTITEVDNGDTVVISEIDVDSSIYTTSYSGATAGEETDDGYTFTMDSSSTEITVTNTTISHKLSVNKVWLDADGQTETGVSHDAVSVQVFEDEDAIGELSLGSGNDWTASMEFVFDSDAAYTVTEDAVEGYTSAVSGPTTDADGDMSFTVTNTAIPTTTVTATKVWDDNDDQDGIRDSYSLTLTGTVKGEDDEDETVYTNTTDEIDKDTLTYTWEGLYTTDSDGNEISYSVSEATVPEDYTASITGNATEGFTVTNTHTPEKTTVSGTKTWEDSNNEDENRPTSITIRLYANGNPVTDGDGDAVIAAVTADADGNWTWSFEDLDKYANGVEIEYTITEDAVYHYSTTYDGYNVTNTHTQGQTSVTVQKVWEDDSNRDGVRPESVTIDLLADGTQVDTLTLSGEGNTWTGSFTGLDQYDGTNAIEYTIVEEGVEDGHLVVNEKYESKVEGDATTGYIITNTYTPESADDISVTKVWNDNDDQDGMRDSYSLTLTGTIEGEDDPVYTDTQTFDKDTLSYTWTGLYKNYGGKEITYSVSESTVPDGYTASVEWNDETKSYTVTNTHTPEKISVAGTKTWDDEEDADGIRPDSIMIHLYTGEEETDTKEVKADADGNWTWGFDNLDKYANGVEIQYSITEDPIDYYETTYSAEGYDVTNTHTPDKTYINYSKVWEDDSNRDQVRPESVTIDLMADGEKVDEKTLTGDENTWDGTFTDLVAYNGTTEIEYTIAEEGVDSEGKIADGKYESSITGDASNGYTITNTYTPESADDITATKIWDDSNDQDGKRDSYSLTLTGTVGEATVYTDTQTLDKETLTYTWENLYKNYEGQEITYSVSESTVPEGYKASVEWDEETEVYVVTNSYTPETVDVEGSKTWVDEGDPDEKPEAITIHLLADGMEIDSATVTAGDDSNWAWSFKDLPKYRDGGTEINYAITEDAVGNYTTTYDEDTYDVTNTYSPETTTVTITKNWDDDSDRDGKRPEDVTVTLTGTNGFSQDVTLNEDTRWIASVDVPMYDNDGSTVEYSVTEETVTGYKDPVITSTDDYNFTVTNTYEPTMIDGEDGTITVKKVWEDADDQDGIRPGSVSITLTGTVSSGEGDNTETETVYTSDSIELSDSNSWSASISGLYKYANGGKEITYSVTESEITVPDGHRTGYVANVTGGADENDEYTFIVTNTHTPEVIGEDGTITITKTWNDASDHDDIRPDSVDFTLTGTIAGENDEGDTVVEESVTLTEDEWIGTIEGLERYSEGEEITYTLTEDKPDGYSSTITALTDADGILTGYTVVNSHEDYTATVTVTKEWEGDEDYEDIYRPSSVTVHLMSDGVDTNQSLELTEEDNWTGELTDVPVFEDGDELHGQKITYTVTEENLPAGYTASETEADLEKDDDGNYTGTVTVTNTLETIGSEENPVTIIKKWNDGKTDHNSVSVTIDSSNWTKADGSYYISETYTLSEANDWTVTVSDLPKYTTENEEIKYVVSEEAVEGYRTSISDMVANNDGSSTFTVTNTALVNGTGEMEVSKEWDDADDQDGIRPESVTVQLYTGEGDEAEAVEGKTLTLDETNGWTDSFTDLDQYDADSKEIVYTVDEINFSDKNGETDTYTSEVAGDAESGFTVTNIHAPETVKVEGSKIWDDNGNEDKVRPEYVIIHLYADGTEISSTRVTGEAEEDEWAWSFTDLPKYRDGGTEIEYTITEDAIYHYSTTYGDDSYDVTNTHTSGQTSVTVTKIWDDVDDYDGIRPESVTIDLLADGEQVDSLTLSGEGNVWTDSFTNLDIYDGDTEIQYSVVEEDFGVGEYESGDPVGDPETGFTITNYHEVDDWSVEKKLTNSGSGDNGAFKFGETAEFEIIVTNTGNAAVGPIEVTEELEGAVFTESESGDYKLNNEKTVATIERLDRDEVVTLYATYTIKEKDLGQEFSNVVTTDDGSREPGPGDEVPVPTEDMNGHLSVSKTTTSEPANKESYALGEEITYEIIVTNDGNLTITDITVTDELTGDEWTIDSLAPGEHSETFEASYTVTEEDILAGSVVNEATVGGTSPDPDVPEVPSEPGTDEEPTEEKKDHLTVTKVTTSEPENGFTYALGEEITYTITVTNDGNVTLTDIIVTDELTQNTWPDNGQSLTLKPGESETFTATYTVTEEDIERGDVLNEATAKGTDPDDETPDPWEGTDDEPTDTPHPSLYVEKTADVDEDYVAAVGDEITYIIYVLNNGNETLTDIKVTDEMTGDEWTIDSLAPGEGWTKTAIYVVTEEDILAGNIENIAAVEADNPNDPEDPVENEGVVDIPTEKKNGHLTVTKETTSEPENGEAYYPGEEITYEITVTNDGNLTITDITVTDEMTGDEWTIDSLAPGESKTFEASYTVTVDDYRNGSVVNEATVEGTSPDPDEPEVPSEPGIDEEPVVSQIQYFPMEEEIVPDNDDEANPGSWVDRESVNEYESIEIEMSTTLPNVDSDWLAEGDFSMTFHNILETQLVLDELESDFTVDINGSPIDSQYYKIDMIQTNSLFRFFSISDGCTFHVNVDLTALYNDGIIKDEDLGTSTVRVFFYADLETTEVNGSYTSTAWYDLADGDEVLYTSDQSVVAVYTFENVIDKYDEDTGEPLQGASFMLYYDEACENPVTRKEENYVVTSNADGQAMFVGIAEGVYHLKELEAPDGYVLSEEVQTVELAGTEDGEHIMEISVGNTAVTASTPEPVPEPEATAPTVTKETTSTPANGKAYVEGEKVVYEITVSNDAEQTIENIVVKDALTGLEETIESLAPGEKQSFITEYVISAADAEAGEVINVATASGTTDDGTDVEDSGKKDVPTQKEETEKPEEGPAVYKEAVSTPANGEYYTAGEKILYKITVENDTDQTIGDIQVKDTLTGDLWTIDMLAPDEEKVFTAEYTVTSQDVADGKVVNVATASGVSDDGIAVTGSDTEEVKTGEAASGGTGSGGTGSGGTGSTGESGSGGTAVKTGDDTPIAPYVSMMLIALLAMGGGLAYRHRRHA